MRAAIALVLVLLAGCGGGPGEEALRKDVEARLAEALPNQAATLVAFARRGSQADIKAPAGETRRVVYYDLDLKLARDYDFGAWDGPGVPDAIAGAEQAAEAIVRALAAR